MNDSEHGVALRLANVGKRFPGTVAVDGVDFDVRAGEVHALMGENGAGKSTLMNILAGAFDDYTGEVFVGGRPVHLRTPAQARAAGVAMIHQELSLAPPLSIAENLCAGRLPGRRGWLDRAALLRESRELLARVGLAADPRAPVEALSQHERQLVEIAKALGGAPAILIMDEPTSALSQAEVDTLFGLIAGLKSRGLAIVYISHHIPEVFRVADRCTVLRDGRRVDTRPLRGLTAEALVEMMIGRRGGAAAVRRARAPGGVRLSVRGLTRYGFFHDVSFDVHAGEILGIGGLAGAGRSELARSLCGIDARDAGEVRLDGAASDGRSFAYLTEDRKQEGLALFNSARDNTLAALTARRRRLVPRREAAGLFARLAEELRLQPPEPGRQTFQFSGGNQQKLLLAKWLAVAPAVCVLDEPTRGVDVGAKRVIHEAVGRLADGGACVILISSDLPELVGLADRVLVLRKGHVVRELAPGTFSEDAVLLAANGAA